MSEAKMAADRLIEACQPNVSKQWVIKDMLKVELRRCNIWV